VQPGLPVADRSRAAKTGAGLASLLALTALIGGLPALLYAVSGPPVPHALPGWHHLAAVLTRPDDGTLFLGAVRLVTWLGWALFTVSAVTEAWCQLRGRQSRWLLAAGPARTLAATLVGATLLGLMPALHVPRHAPAHPAWPGRAVASALPWPARETRAAHAMPASRPPGRQAPDGPARTPPAHRWTRYLVAPGDDLWAIAARHLGAGARSSP
jgi:hypothetical protein